MAASLAPVGLPIAALAAVGIVAVDSYNPIFMQKRYGSIDNPFAMYKLRTMQPDAEETSSQGHKDNRCSEFAQLLRATRVDETPQLINVGRGHMSIVGYRPLIRTHMEETLDGLQP